MVGGGGPGAPAFVDDFDGQQYKMVPTTGSWSLVWWGLYLQQDLTGNASLLTPSSGTYGDQIVEADGCRSE